MNKLTKSIEFFQFFIAKDQQVVDGFLDLQHKTEWKKKCVTC